MAFHLSPSFLPISILFFSLVLSLFSLNLSRDGWEPLRGSRCHGPIMAPKLFVAKINREIANKMVADSQVCEKGGKTKKKWKKRKRGRERRGERGREVEERRTETIPRFRSARFNRLLFVLASRQGKVSQLLRTKEIASSFSSIFLSSFCSTSTREERSLKSFLSRGSPARQLRLGSTSNEILFYFYRARTEMLGPSDRSCFVIFTIKLRDKKRKGRKIAQERIFL